MGSVWPAVATALTPRKTPVPRLPIPHYALKPAWYTDYSVGLSTERPKFKSLLGQGDPWGTVDQLSSPSLMYFTGMFWGWKGQRYNESCAELLGGRVGYKCDNNAWGMNDLVWTKIHIYKNIVANQSITCDKLCKISVHSDPIPKKGFQSKIPFSRSPTPASLKQKIPLRAWPSKQNHWCYWTNMFWSLTVKCLPSALCSELKCNLSRVWCLRGCLIGPWRRRRKEQKSKT